MDDKITERYEKALELAARVLESEANAVAWLKAPSIPLGNVKPESLLNTDKGFELVLRELYRIEHGLPV